MLEHLNPAPVAPRRIVVMGAAGFVGGAIAARAEREGIPVLALGHAEVDLLAPEATRKLGSLLRPDDAFVAVSAMAPCKNADMLVKNIVMGRAMVEALAAHPVSHVTYISSDAVYADNPLPIDETWWAAPSTLHGAMHVAREALFRSEIAAPLVLLRPSLLYGAKDPHNGYGPNRFRRQIELGQDITLFGEGEERRDHVYIGDLAELAIQVILNRSRGVLNVASGEVISFRLIAEKMIAASGRKLRVKGTPRSGPMPHNGYRPFDVSTYRAAFPQFRPTTIEQGLTLLLSSDRAASARKD